VEAGDSKVSETIQEIVQFLDENAGHETGFKSVMDSVTEADEAITNADLSNYLARPVRIFTYTWNESDAIGTQNDIQPWRLFFQDAAIKRKLDNYAFIQCDLKIKVLVNASPFYYGATMMSYQPLPALTPSTIVNDTGTRYFIPYSQRPHAWIYPSANEGCEMTLPFFLNYNWLRVQTLTDFTNMGTLSFQNFTVLDSANGVTGAGVTVQVYAWAENVRVSGPSVSLSLQARDEYTGPVSSIASALAAAAGALGKVPIIGKYATATQMGMMGVANGARHLGFTNVPVISDVQPLRPSSNAPIATSEVSYPVEKLTLDPKNELSIDPGVAGLNSTDELSISHLVQKESYLTSTLWSTAQTTDTVLFRSAVTPYQFADDYLSNEKIYMTPMCFVGQHFNGWRGDVIFRFRFVASPYHKGRVRISYDPAGRGGTNVVTSANSTSQIFTQLVDLGKDTDVEVRVPYQQALAWLEDPGGFGAEPWSTSTSPTFNYNSNLHNGTIIMRVLTQLTAPVAISSIRVLVFVRGAENLEFANPGHFTTESSNQYSYFAPQSQDEVVQKIVAGTLQSPASERYLVNYGEAVTSMRQILRRASMVDYQKITAATVTNTLAESNRVFSRIPPTPGYDPFGTGLATPIVGVGNKSYNWCFFHPIAYFQAAFIGYRGSTIWHFNVDSPDPQGWISCTRRVASNTVNAVWTSTAVAPSSSTNSFASANALRNLPGTAGMAFTNQQTQAGLSVSLPNYAQYKFQSTAPQRATAFGSDDGSRYDSALLNITGYYSPNVATNKGLWSFAGIGTDYTCVFFLNVPTLYRYSGTPAPV
jgi:hypothetical protein